MENVKSAWQALRGEKDWTRGKDRIDNDRTKKLYEILEKMTCKIDRVQRNYMDPKANHYLRRSASNVLRTSTRSKPSLQEEAEIVRNIIFPDRKARTKSAVSYLTNVNSEISGKDMARIRFDEAAKDILMDQQLSKNLSKYTTKKRSIHTEVYERDIANDIQSVHTIAPNICNKRQDTAVTDTVKSLSTDDGNKMRMRIKSSIEEYLQHYSDNVHKSRSVEKKEEERSRNIKPLTNDIADILESHNIGSHVFYEHFEKYSDDSEDYISDEDRPCLNTTTNTTQMTSVDTIQDRKIRDDTSVENTGLCNDTRATKAVDVKSFDIRRQSSVTNCQDNAFIKMGLNKNLSRDTLSQILQSEYLRKDLSL